MTNFCKYAVLLLFVMSLAQSAFAQVKLSLTLLGDQETYLVSMVSDQSWTAPYNAVGSMQVALRYPAGKSFVAGRITSFIPGISWSDNAYVESPTATNDYNFVCFSLNERGTKNIPFPAGEEVPLFTFVNLAKDCVGKIELLDNQNELVQRIVQKDQLNVTQNITVLGARGNAYAGVLNASVDCNLRAITIKKPENGIKRLRAFPVPTADELQVYWENSTDQGPNRLVVANVLGEVVQLHQNLDPKVLGEQSLRLDVSMLASGLYTGTLLTAQGQKQAFRFLVTRQ